MLVESKQARIKSLADQGLSNLILSHYNSLHEARAKKKFVIWAAICVPVEIFKGFDDIVVAIPENHSAMSAAKNAGVPLAEQAEQLGFSMDICSYARIDLGTELGDSRLSPARGLPRPDLLVSDTNNCSLLVKWFDVYHRLWDVPHFVIDVPFCYENQKEKDTSYISDQLHALISLIETKTGQRFDINKVAAALRQTYDAMGYWKEFLSLASHRPSPITVFDTFAHMAPFVIMRGDELTTNHYRLLVNEMKARIAEHNYPVQPERYRLIWDNIAPWHQLRAMKTRLAAAGANIVHATYTSCMGTIEGGFERYPWDGNDPIRFLARTQNFSVCPYGLSLRFKAMAAIIKHVGIDGVIFASNRSCKVYSIMQLDLQKMIGDQLGVPTIMIDVDHADIRKYNEEGVFTRVEALLELIDQKRQETRTGEK